MFKVVPDQLRVSDGWVRCGQCDEVFDANIHMQSSMPIAGSPVPIRKNVWGESTPEIVPQAVGAGAREVVVNNATEKNWKPEPEPDTVDPLAEEALAQLVPKIDAELIDAKEPVQAVEQEVDPVSTLRDLEPPSSQEGSRDFEADGPVQNMEDDEPKLSFMQTPSVPSTWRNSLVRAGLAVLCVLFGGVLFLQVLIQERDRIAATEPDVKPLLVSVCAVWGCEISPLRQIDSIVIESSSFVKVRAEVYRLNFTLKNTAKIDVALPALELSLTDMQEKPVIRRVIGTPDFTHQQGPMGPGAEFSASLPVSVKLPGNTERISGYRLLAFYP